MHMFLFKTAYMYEKCTPPHKASMVKWLFKLNSCRVKLIISNLFVLDMQYKITTDTNFGRNFVFKKAKETVSPT